MKKTYYTPEMEEAIRADSPLSRSAAIKLAARLALPPRSVIAKAISIGYPVEASAYEMLLNLYSWQNLSGTSKEEKI
jgi:hypothetical protein